MTRAERAVTGGHGVAARRVPAWLPLLFVASAAPLAGCGHDQPPPLTGNLTDTLTDSRGAHAGSFRGSGNVTADYGDAAGPAGEGNVAGPADGSNAAGVAGGDDAHHTTHAGNQGNTQ